MTLSSASRARGFTLVELLVALSLMALLALMSWRGLDGMTQSAQINSARGTAVLALQTGLAQWQADLDALAPDAGVTPLDWDGQTLRLTRRVQTTQTSATPTPDPGLRVVAWTRRAAGSADSGNAGQWLRWQSAPVQSVAAWSQAWSAAQLWAQNPGADSVRQQTAVTPLVGWLVQYHRSGAWTNAQSSGQSGAQTTVVTAPQAAASGTATQPVTTGTINSNNTVPDAVRLQLQLPDGGDGLTGTLTLDWVNPLLVVRKS